MLAIRLLSVGWAIAHHRPALRLPQSRALALVGLRRLYASFLGTPATWAEMKSWLSTEASQTCDVLVLQETHWQATAEFSASGWYCVSSASPDDTLKATKSKEGREGTAHIAQEAEARPESSQDQTRQVPPWSGQTRQEEATQSRRARLTQHSGTAPRHIWVQSQSGRACCDMGGGLRLRPSQLCSLLSCYRRGQGVLGVTAYVLWSTQPSLRPIAGSPELPSVGRH